jgi:hypothetical protein
MKIIALSYASGFTPNARVNESKIIISYWIYGSNLGI